jgi:IS30 family transposase
MPRTSSLTQEQEELIYSLSIRRVPIGTIAEQVGVHRNTVRPAIARLTAQMNERSTESLEVLRRQALAVYGELETECWTRLRECVPTSRMALGFIATIMQLRRQQDRLLGLEQLTVTQQGPQLQQLQALLRQPVTVIQVKEEPDDETEDDTEDE